MYSYHNNILISVMLFSSSDFNTLIVNPYQKMAEWFQKKRAWSDHYFFKKAPNGDSRVEESSGDSTRVDQSQPTVTTQGHTSVDSRTTMGSHAPNGNGRHGYHTGGSLGTNDGVGVSDKAVVFHTLTIWFIYDYEYKK